VASQSPQFACQPPTPDDAVSYSHDARSFSSRRHAHRP
jgi:hypothetical protein